MSFRDNGDKEKVQAATDIVRLVGEHVTLRPKGKEFAGLCPFHDDKTPSMQVSPQKQIYKCFSCGAGGDAFSFVMNYHKMDFVESLKFLAEKAGIELTPWKPDGKGGSGESASGGERKRIAAANEMAVSFFKALLKHETHGADARAYLERRGVTQEMIDTFGLGYAPDRWDGLVTMVRERGWDKQGFELAQLIRPRKTGDGDFDFLRHRLVFPIFDAIGRPIAFGGRKLRDEDEPKYLNSPETTLFNKSATLYGLHAAKKPIIDAKTAVIVEGYTDVIACHQAGARNVVAALGTALTPQHVRELRRYCEQVVLVMDGDVAGQKAADRAIEVFLTADLDVSITVLPVGQDPDEILKSGGIDAWNQALGERTEALQFKLDLIKDELKHDGSFISMQRVTSRFIDMLVNSGLDRMSMEKRNWLVKKLSMLLGSTQRQLYSRISDSLKIKKSQDLMRERSSGSNNEESNTDHSNISDDSTIESESYGDKIVSRADVIAQKMIVGCLVREPKLFYERNVDEELSPDEIDGDLGTLYRIIYNRLSSDKDASMQSVLAYLAEGGLSNLSGLLVSIEHRIDEMISCSTSTNSSILQGHIDYLRFSRERHDYLRKRLNFFFKYRSKQTTEEEIDAFLVQAADFYKSNPWAGRIGHTEITDEAQTYDDKFEQIMSDNLRSNVG